MRLDGLQKITRSLYEDKALGRISDEDYTRFSTGFSVESKQGEARLVEINTILANEQTNLENANRFLKIIEKYIDVKELDKKILNELVDHIEVHEAEKINGKRVQKVDICYRFVGNITMNV